MPPTRRAKINGAEQTSGSHAKGLAVTVMIDRLQFEDGLATRTRRTPRSVSVVAIMRNPTGFDKPRPSLQRDRMSAHRVSAALRRARSRSRNYHSVRRFDRDITPTSQACSPAISGDACAQSARRRRSRACSARKHRRWRRYRETDREDNHRRVPTPWPSTAPRCQSCSSERRNSRCHGGNTRVGPPR